VTGRRAPLQRRKPAWTPDPLDFRLVAPCGRRRRGSRSSVATAYVPARPPNRRGGAGWPTPRRSRTRERRRPACPPERHNRLSATPAFGRRLRPGPPWWPLTNPGGPRAIRAAVVRGGMYARAGSVLCLFREPGHGHDVQVNSSSTGPGSRYGNYRLVGPTQAGARLSPDGSLAATTTFRVPATRMPTRASFSTRTVVSPYRRLRQPGTRGRSRLDGGRQSSSRRLTRKTCGGVHVRRLTTPLLRHGGVGRATTWLVRGSLSAADPRLDPRRRRVALSLSPDGTRVVIKTPGQPAARTVGRLAVYNLASGAEDPRSPKREASTTRPSGWDDNARRIRTTPDARPAPASSDIWVTPPADGTGLPLPPDLRRPGPPAVVQLTPPFPPFPPLPRLPRLRASPRSTPPPASTASPPPLLSRFPLPRTLPRSFGVVAQMPPQLRARGWPSRLARGDIPISRVALLPSLVPRLPLIGIAIRIVGLAAALPLPHHGDTK